MEYYLEFVEYRGDLLIVKWLFDTDYLKKTMLTSQLLSSARQMTPFSHHTTVGVNNHGANQM